LQLEIDNISKLLVDFPDKIETSSQKLLNLTAELERLKTEISTLLTQKDELSKFAENIEQEAKELSSKEVLDILRSDYDSRIQKLQKLAQTILESLLYEKREVYYHKKSGEEEKKSSVQTLHAITARYTYILQSIIKVSKQKKIV